MLAAARVAAAIEILDLIADGDTPEKALTGWGRTHRFAGSKDRAAIRDHVFQALRCRASYGWIGGANTGRGIMLGAMQTQGDVGSVFTGEGHAPAPVEVHETLRDLQDADRATRYDMPDWLLPHFDAAFGAQADDVLTTLQSRAGVFLRVNAARSTAAAVIASLAEDAIVATSVHNVKNALQVIENERRVALSSAYLSGLIELQDTSSQVAIAALELKAGQRVLDFCAGGGGKALAMAALGAEVFAHDIDSRRMIDLEPRAERADVTITQLTTDRLDTVDPCDVVFVDAPCSGSGTWRRTPATKWDLTPERLQDLTDIQLDVVTQAAEFVAPNGVLAYATCSVFGVENNDIIQRFMDRSSGFEKVNQAAIRPHALGDGFFYTVLRRIA